MTGLLNKLHTDYLALVERDKKADDDRRRSERVRFEGMREHGIEVLSTSLGCDAHELFDENGAFKIEPGGVYMQTDGYMATESISTFEFHMRTRIPGLWIRVLQSKAGGHRTVSIFDDNVEEGFDLPAEKDVVLRLIGSALNASWEAEP